MIQTARGMNQLRLKKLHVHRTTCTSEWQLKLFHVWFDAGNMCHVLVSVREIYGQ